MSEFTPCVSCGRPTRSHTVGRDERDRPNHICHSCWGYRDDDRVADALASVGALTASRLRDLLDVVHEHSSPADLDEGEAERFTRFDPAFEHEFDVRRVDGAELAVFAGVETDGSTVTFDGPFPGVMWTGNEFDTPVFAVVIRYRLDPDTPVYSATLCAGTTLDDLEAAVERFFDHYESHWGDLGVYEADGGNGLDDLQERVEIFVANSPGADVMDVLAQLRLGPEHRELVKAVVDGEPPDSADVQEVDKPNTGLQNLPDEAHENPIDAGDVTDAERAGMLRRYLEAFVEEFGETPRLMPLDEDGKAPAAGVTYASGRAELVDGDEAIRRIREDGARGFALYAGRWDCNTEDLVLVDVDDRETFPYEAFPDTLEVLSGSGRGEHFTFRNAGDVANAKGKDGVDGEVRAKNWYCITPGSVHPSGGVYHITAERDVATIAHDDLPEELQPGTTQLGRDEIVDLNPPEDLANAQFRSDFDASLDELRERDEKLDALLTDLEPPGYGYPSPSEADFATAGKLWFWGFDTQQIADIIRKHRRRPKVVERDGYLATTISKAARGDRYEPPGSTGESRQSPEPVSALPLGQLDALPPADRRRAARKRGLDWPTTDEARDRLFEAIAAVMRNEDQRVVDGPTALGKSYAVASTRWGARDDITGGRPVVHLLETRAARDEAARVAEREGGTHLVLEARHEACPVAAGEYDPDVADEHDDREAITVQGLPASEWLDAICDGRGIPFSSAHRYLEDHNDQGVELPCCQGESICWGIEQWDVYREGDHPLIIATHNFAFAPGLRLGNNIVLDEEPDFAQDLSTDRVRRAVGAYLREIDAPVSTWEAFVQLVRYEGYGDDASRERDALEGAINAEPDREWYFQNPDAHTLAPALARAIFYAEERANGRRAGKTAYEPPRLDAHAHDDDAWNRTWVTVVLDETNDVRTVRVVPDLNSARSVVGLDAHPALPVWQANTLPWMGKKTVLDATERQLWKRYERGLRVVQVGDATRPLASGEYFAPDQVEALTDHLVEEYGRDFRTAITTKAVESQLADAMRDAGVADPETMHYGEEKSRNDFAGEPIGLVEGCIDPGDDFVLDLLAELDQDATPEMTTVESDDVVDDDGEERRAHGRGFVGPDADTAAAILASVREAHTAQAAGRYARSPDDPAATATVFVRTDAMPPGFADVQVPGVEWVFGQKQREIVEALRDRARSATARDLADEIGISKSHVRKTLKRLAEHDVVDALEGAGPHGATLYSESGLPTTGVVQVNEDIADSPVWDSSTWASAIREPDQPDERDPPERSGEPPPQTSVWDWRGSSDGGPRS